MKLRELPFVLLARSGGVTPRAAAGCDMSLLDPCFRDGAGVAFSDNVRRGRGREGEGRRFLARLRIGTAIAPTRQ